MSPKNTLLIVADIPALRSYFAKVINKSSLAQENIEIIEAANSLQAIDLFSCIKPDKVLMDIVMPQTNGIQLAQKMWAMNESASILFWSQFHKTAFINILGKMVPEQAVHGYIVTSDGDDKLLSAIDSVFVQNLPYIDAVHNKTKNNLEKKEDCILNDTEWEMLTDILLGLTDKAIAARRQISVRGVQNRFSNLAKKIVGKKPFQLQEISGMEIFNPRTKLILEAIKKDFISVEQIVDMDPQFEYWLHFSKRSIAS